jgi:hypothetical protein
MLRGLKIEPIDIYYIINPIKSNVEYRDPTVI